MLLLPVEVWHLPSQSKKNLEIYQNKKNEVSLSFKSSLTNERKQKFECDLNFKQCFSLFY